MNQFQGNVQYQRQVVSDRHQQIRREFGASRTRRVAGVPARTNPIRAEPVARPDHTPLGMRPLR